MRLQLASAALAAVLVTVPLSAASASTDVPSGVIQAAQTTTDSGDGGDEGLWGLAGLLGLVGLAGLKRRKDTDHSSRSGTTTR